MIAITVKTNNNRIEVQTARNGLIIARLDEIRHIECNDHLMLVQTVDGKHTLIVLAIDRKDELKESIKAAIKNHDDYMFNRKSYAGQFEPAVNYKQSMKEWGIRV